MVYAVAARADSMTDPALLSDVHQGEKWSKPTEGKLKIDVDGAFSQLTGAGGWGYVIRDGQGVVRNAGAGSEEALQSVFHAEPLACREDLRAAASLGMANVVMESDELMVKAAIEGEDYRLSAMGGIVTEIKILKAMEFASCEYFLLLANL